LRIKVHGREKLVKSKVSEVKGQNLRPIYDQSK